MRFGFQISNTEGDWPAMLALAQAADRLRWHSVWPFDHFMYPLDPEREADPCLEGWTLLAALAARTERVRLGCLVSAVTFRSPALLAKMAATVDHISGGRLVLGLGAGWHEREHEAYGLPFPDRGERSDRLEEAAGLLRRLLRAEGPVDFEGRHYRLRQAPFAPRSHCPILIGGEGEKRTLRTVALHGDAMNVHGSPEVVEAKVRALEAHCRDVGRDPSEIARTVTLRSRLFEDEARGTRAREKHGGPLGGPGFLLPLFRRYQDLGVSEVIFQGLPPTVEELEKWDRLVLSHF